MNRHAIKALLTSIALFLCQTPAYSELQKIRIIYGDGGYEPFYYTRCATEECVVTGGMLLEFLERFEETYGEDFYFVHDPLPRRRMDKEMSAKLADVFSLNSRAFMSLDDQKRFIFSDPIFTTRDFLYSRKNDPVQFDGDLTKLYGKTIGTILGNSYFSLDHYFSKGLIRRHDVRQSLQQYEMLTSHKRLDMIINNEHTFPAQLRRLKLPMDNLHRSEAPLYEFDLVMVMQPKLITLQKRINRFIRESKHNGYLSNLQKRYQLHRQPN